MESHTVLSQTIADIEAPAKTFQKGSNDKIKIVSGPALRFAEWKIRMALLGLAIKNYPLPWHWYKVCSGLEKNRVRYLGKDPIRKMALVEGRYYYDLYAPGFPSKAFNKYFEGEMNRIVPIPKKTNRFINAFVAVTKKCPMQCEHCYEWDVLNQKEVLSTNDLRLIVDRFTELGVSQIHFGGGEPMLRFKDLLPIIKEKSAEIDFWMVTSAYKLTKENARELKSAGLKGVAISLDHFDKEAHNKFRGSSHSFDWVKTGIQAANEAGLVTCLSVCITKTFASKNSIYKYYELAKELGPAFVQLLEPKAVGRYRDKDVLLSIAQEKLLEEINHELSYSVKYKAYPVMSYHGYYQRRSGCFGAGSRHLYCNTDGQIQACPFCQLNLGSALDDEFDKVIEGIESIACETYEKSNF